MRTGLPPLTWRDGVAAAVVLAGMVLVFGSGPGGGGKGGDDAVDFGTLVERTEAASDCMAKAAETKVDRDQALAEAPPRTANATKEAAPAPPEADGAAPSSTKLRTADEAAGPPPAAQQRPSTPVEPRPRPLQELSTDEVDTLVESYRGWADQGEITVRLDLSRVSPERAASISDCVVIGNENHRVVVWPSGKSEVFQGLDPHRLISDLEPARWPESLSDAALRWFGPGPRLGAIYVLSRPAELAAYRLVAARSPRPGMEVVLGLRPDGQGDHAFEVVSVRQAPLHHGGGGLWKH